MVSTDARTRRLLLGCVALGAVGTACLTDYAVEEDGSGGAPGTTSATGLAPTSSDSTGASSQAASSSGQGTSTSGSSSASTGGAVEPCPPVDGLVGRWVADDAVVGLADGDPVEAWPSRIDPATDLTTALGPPPTVASATLNEHALLHFEPRPFPVDVHATYLEAAVAPGDPATRRDEVTIVVVTDVASEEVRRIVQWGEPIANNLDFCIGEDATFGLSASRHALDIQVQHVPSPSLSCGASGVQREAGSGPSVLVGMRARTGHDPRNYIHQNGRSLFAGGSLDRFGGVGFGSDMLRVGAATDGDFGFSGDVAEVLVYRRAFDDEQLLALETCVGATYGIDVATHPEACENGDLDGGEVGTDCSGSCAARCTLGARCTKGEDCESGLCDTTLPVPACIAQPVGHRLEEVEGASLPDVVEPFAAYYDPVAHAVRALASNAGEDGDDRTTRVFELDGDTWNEVPDVKTPAARTSPAFYQDGERAWLYGGESDGPLDDLWIFDDGEWVEPEVTFAPPLSGAGLALDGAGNLLLFGGTDQVGTNHGAYRFVLEPDVATGWETRTAMLDALVPNLPGAFADDQHQVIALGGGIGLNTWSCNGNAWTEAGAIAPILASRKGHSLVRDTTRRRIVLIGGIDEAGAGDVLEWYPPPQQITLNTLPWIPSVASGGPVDAGVAAFDVGRQRVVYLERGSRTFAYWAVAAACSAPSDCFSGHCEDEICCDRECSAGERCDSENAPGVCVAD